MAEPRLRFLRQDIEQALFSIPTHAKKSFAERKWLLESLVNDLVLLHRAVPKLTSLREPILRDLILLWQERGNSMNTIYRKISVLRKILSEYLPSHVFPDNKTLGLAYEVKINPPKPTPYDIDNINSLTVKQICQLQLYFGLKKQEALQFEPFMLTDKELRLSREAAYNNQNRTIPYWDDKQQAVAQELKQQLPAKGFKANYSNLALLSSLHHHEITQQGIDNKEYFRTAYLLQRFQHLTQKAQAATAYVALKQLREELGYHDNRQIKAILTCLGAF